MKKILALGFILLFLSYFIAFSIYTNIYMFFGELQGNFDDYFSTFFSYIYQAEFLVNFMTNIFVEQWWAYVLLVPLSIFAGFIWAFQTQFSVKEKYEEADEYGIHGTSKWASPLDLMNGKIFIKKSKSGYGNSKKTLSLPSGYILGRVPDKKKLIVMDDQTDIDNQHMLVVGSSGASKSQSFVIPNLINVKDKSIIVTDPKGELYNMTAQLKADQGYKVYQIDFVHFMQSRYNPLTYVETDIQAQQVANTIISNFEGEGSGDNAFFKNNATNMLSALIIYVKAEFPQEQANMATLVDVYTNHVQDEEKFEEWFEQIPVDHPAKKMLASILDLTGNTRGSVTSTLNNGLSIFKLKKVQHMTAVSDFRFEDFVDDKSVLYVKLSMENDTFNPLTSVFFAQMIDIFYDIAKMSPNETLKRKVLMLLDEFANIGKINNYSKVMSTSRSLGLIMATVIQNKAQLEKRNMYGKEEAKEIMANHDVKLILRADKTDSDTTKWISESLGNTTVKQNKSSLTKSEKSASRSINHEYVKRPLMTPEEVGSLKKDESIIIVSGYNPIFAKKAFQYEIYPNLITNKKRELNYNKMRNKLGYNTPLMPKNNFTEFKDETFSDYQKKKEDSQKNEEVPAETSNHNEIKNMRDEDKLAILDEVGTEYMAEIEKATNSLNKVTYTEKEIDFKNNLISDIINGKSNHRYFLFDNITQYTNITHDELQTYINNGMSIEAVEKERNKRNKNKLEKMNIN